jgi:hypothetical protein
MHLSHEAFQYTIHLARPTFLYQIPAHVLALQEGLQGPTTVQQPVSIGKAVFAPSQPACNQVRLCGHGGKHAKVKLKTLFAGCRLASYTSGMQTTHTFV